jgi:hypothetical protein
MARVEASLNYLAPGEDKPVYQASSEGVGHHDVGVRFESRRVSVTDARSLSYTPILDEQGFALASHPTAIGDFYKLDIALYERELQALVGAASGGCEVVVFDHTLRSDSIRIRGKHNTREPAHFIHNDYTNSSAFKRYCDLINDGRLSIRAAGRFAIINVWRTVSNMVHKSPVAVCDATTLSPGDLVAAERRAAGRVGELEFARWNPEHRWYYFSQMAFDEALLIKTFDSSETGVATRCIHSAFDNPLAPAEAPARESIESRLLVLFN